MRFVEIEDERGERFVHAAVARAVVGYSAEDPVPAKARRQAHLDAIFRGHGRAPAASTVLAATDQNGNELYGAVVLDAPFYATLAVRDPERARALAQLHRVVAGLFVADAYRGDGLGTYLLCELAAGHALERGVRYLDGFVDDRNGSADFYRKAGLTVMAHNTGLPSRRPSLTALEHHQELDGHWFYLDLWATYVDRMRCKECAGELTFVPDDLGGDLRCPRTRVDEVGRLVHDVRPAPGGQP